jgi:FkbM family methyltransferase
MDREPSYSICLHPNGELISEAIRADGQWSDCKHFPAAVKQSIRIQIQRSLLAATDSETMEEFLNVSDPFLTGVVVDVGANIGSCAFELANLGHEIFDFEAVTANVQLLEATRTLNDFKGRVHILHGLVTNTSQNSVHLSTSLNRGNMGSQIVRSAPGDPTHKNPREGETPAWKLDDIIKQRVDFMKLDCQGCEYNAVFGAEKLFSQYGVGLLHMELAPLSLRQVSGMDSAATDLLLKLVDHGLTLWAGNSPSVTELATHADVLEYMAADRWAGDVEENLWAAKKGAQLPSLLF